MDGFKNGLKAFVSWSRDWLEGTELKLQVSVSELNGQGPIPQHNTFIMSANVFTISKESKFLQRAKK